MDPAVVASATTLSAAVPSTLTADPATRLVPSMRIVVAGTSLQSSAGTTPVIDGGPTIWKSADAVAVQFAGAGFVTTIGTGPIGSDVVSTATVKLEQVCTCWPGTPASTHDPGVGVASAPFTVTVNAVPPTTRKPAPLTVNVVDALSAV
jgi:hypothetical protein